MVVGVAEAEGERDKYAKNANNNVAATGISWRERRTNVVAAW
jgi:hypothetical protein